VFRRPYNRTYVILYDQIRVLLAITVRTTNDDILVNVSATAEVMSEVFFNHSHNIQLSR
jgi:hypothetical protein